MAFPHSSPKCFHSRNLTGPASVETPAQKKARMEADLKIKAGAFWKLWSWSLRPRSWQQETSGQRLGGSEGMDWPWKGLFGRSSTSELLIFPVSAAEVPKVCEKPSSVASADSVVSIFQCKLPIFAFPYFFE